MTEINSCIAPMTATHIEQILKISEASKINVWSAKDYAEELLRSDTYAIIYQNQINKNVYGFLLARLIKTKNTTSESKFNIKANDFNSTLKSAFNEAEVLNIAVLPESQNRGIGQEIFNSFLRFCRKNKIENVWLEVRESNLSAQKFYGKNGFEVVYKRNNYYTDPVENALVMQMQMRFI
ncbi:MAG: alanine acetyltransferase [Acidobacteria bacterium]|nr:alanine acetyltransferase [Acidobacteriota bacterium]